jgi:protoporphyrinogen oxidase
LKNKKVIVVGAGASGLSAAYRLQQAGFQVTTIESSKSFGGRVQSLHKDGYILDLGADANTDGYKTYLALSNELGLQGKFAPITSVVGTVVKGKVRYMDLASRLSMIFTSAYSLPAKLQIMKGMKGIAGDLAGIQHSALYQSAHLDDPTRSAEDYGLQHFGREATDYMIEPMARLFQTTSGRDTSALDIAAGFALAGAKTWTFLGGANVLMKALAERLSIQYESHVEAVNEEEGGVTVRYRRATGETVSDRCDACVLAMMFEDILKVCPMVGDIAPELKANIVHMRSNKIHVGYTVPTRTQAYTVQVPSRESREFFVIFLDHNKAPDRAPKGHSLFNLQTDSRFFEESKAMSAEQLIALARRTVEKYFPEVAGHFSGLGYVTRWPRLGNMNYPGYYRNVAKFVERLDESSRVQIAGDVFSKSSQEAAAARGERVANNLKQLLI